jgi:hypothetical protein
MFLQNMILQTYLIICNKFIPDFSSEFWVGLLQQSDLLQQFFLLVLSLSQLRANSSRVLPQEFSAIAFYHYRTISFKEKLRGKVYEKLILSQNMVITNELRGSYL